MRRVKAVKERLNFQTNYVKHTANRQFNGFARDFHTLRAKAKCSAVLPDLQRVQITRKQSQEKKESNLATRKRSNFPRRLYKEATVAK